MIVHRGVMLVAAGGVLGGALAALGAAGLSSVLFVYVFEPVSFGLAFLSEVDLAAWRRRQSRRESSVTGYRPGAADPN